MAGNASDFLEVNFRKHVFRTGSYAKPTALWVALWIGDPLDTGAGGAEVSGGAYARVQLDPGDANWSAPDGTGGVTANLVALTFPAPTGANWGTVTHFVVMDESFNHLVHAPLTSSQVINDGDPAPLFPVGTLIVTFS